MPKLLIHIGTHKTGTTSIQRFCSNNRDALRRIGLWYPPTEIGPFPKHYAHHRIAHAIAGRDGERGEREARQFFERVAKRSKGDETCLISAEPMYRHHLPPLRPHGDDSPPTEEEKQDRFKRYAQAVRRCTEGFDVTIMVMFRRQDLYLESLYAEQVMATGYDQTIERFAVERQPLLEYATRVDDWASVFGRDAVSVATYEKSMLDRPIERTFVEWTGSDWSSDFEIGARHNVSLTRALVEFKRLINANGRGVEANNQIRRWVEELGRQAAAGEISLLDLGKYYLQPRDRRDLLRANEEGNCRLSREYLGRNALFVDPPTAEFEDYHDRGNFGFPAFRILAGQLAHVAALDALG